MQELRIEVNKPCNLACIHCYTVKRGPVPMPVAAFAPVIADAARHGATALSLTGGEPLLEPERVTALARLGREHAMSVRLNTNAFLVDTAMIRRLAEAGVSELQISLCGASIEQFDAFARRTGAFLAVLDAAMAARDLGMDFAIRYTLMPETTSELLSTADLAHQLYAKAFKVRALVPAAAVTSPHWEAHTEAMREALLTLLRRDDGLLSDADRSAYARHLLACKCGSGALFISSTGDVFPCPFLREDTQQRLGSLETEALDDIITGSVRLKDFIGRPASPAHANDAGALCKATVLSLRG
jgi:MoaA/NifB/PqqE/SkfB family radical SAM enzyme